MNSPADESPAVLEARHLTRRTHEGETLLDAVSLRIAAGQRWAIAGPTGAGKTLLLRALALLDPIDGGEIVFRGEPIADEDVPAYRRQVIYLQQKPALIEGTVEDNLRLPFTFRVNDDLNFDRERIVEWLAALELDESFLAKESKELSGGESQITALLRAVQLDPLVLLLDEPTASLDAAAGRLTERYIDGWLREAETDRAVVWVTHDESQRDRVADVQLAMHNGRVGA